MLLIARRTALAAALLLVMPLTVWLSGWLWQPGLPVAMLKSLWWVTETVTQPWGIITHVVLCGWFLWCLRFRLRAALILFLILAAAILAGQGAKSWVKARVQEPRPFVIWLENTRQVPVTQFYALKRKERAKLVHEQLGAGAGHSVIFTQTLAEGDGVCFPVRSHHVCRQLGVTRCGAAVAASPLGHNRGAAGVGDGGDGQSPGAGHALAAGSHRRHADLLAAGHGGLLADAAPLWAALAARRRGAGY